MPGLLDLPTDLLLAILEFAFVVEDILSLRQVCHTLYEVCSSRSVWQCALQRHVFDQDMPVPRLKGPINTLTNKELEHCVLRAVRLRRNWSSPTPGHRPVTRISPSIARDQPARNIATHFISGDGGRRWLLTLLVSGQHWTLDCWDIGSYPPRLIGQHQYPPRTICGVAFNTDEQCENSVAICQKDGFVHSVLRGPRYLIPVHRSVEVLSLDLGALNPADVFFVSVRLSTTNLVEGCRLPVLNGKFLLIQYPTGRLGLVHIDRPSQEVQLASVTSSDEAACLAAIFNLNTAVIFRRKSVEIYDITLLGSSADQQQIQLSPLDFYIWQWGADKLSAIALPQWPDTHSSTKQLYFPITILLRHGSIYPWPVNFLHQYTLGLDPHYDPTLPLSRTNIPYIITPVPIRAISSPVRLTAVSSSTLGSYGTAVWFDSNTEEFYGPGTGQRVAGIFTSLPPVDNDEDRSQHGHQEAREFTAASVLHMEPSSIFASQNQDSWVNIAVDEVEGRIALGREDGGVDLFEYE